MINSIEFRGLKFKTSFNFKNRIERGKYFNNLLIENINLFKEKQKEYFIEKLHVIFSYFITFKFLAFGILLAALLSPMYNIMIAYIALVSFITSLILNKKFKKDLFKYDFAMSMNEMPEFIEILRDDLIENKNNNKNVKTKQSSN